MKRLIGSIVFITIIIASGISFAENADSNGDSYSFELGASSSGLEARFDARRPVDQGYLTAGVGGVYEDNHEEYKILDAKIAFGSENLVPQLTVELGFKGFLGDIERRRRDGDLAAIGFLLAAAYEIPKTVSPIPVEFFASACLAPSPLSFLDSERFSQIGFGVGFHVIENAAVLLGYKHINVHIHEHHRHWTMRDDAVSIGLRLSY
jgi:hypothetical protein